MAIRFLALGVLLLLLGSLDCSGGTKDSDITHFSSAISYANSATRVINKGGSYSVIDPKDMESIVGFYKQALEAANLVNTEGLNRAYPYLGDHFRTEFSEGIRLFVQGFETGDGRTSFQGQVLLDEWGKWYGQNVEAIRKRL